MQHSAVYYAQYVQKCKQWQHCKSNTVQNATQQFIRRKRLQILITKMADAMENATFDEGKLNKLLISTRLDMEAEFISGRKNKSVLWGQVLQKMKESYPNLNLNKEQLTRKFLNLRTTYKIIKARNKESGRSAVAWNFFEDFDQIYGRRHSISPPSINLISSLDTSGYTEILSQDDDAQDSEDSPTPKKKRSRSQNEVLEYLAEESKKEQKRHKEMLAIEERKLEVKEKRIKAMLELKEVLEKTISNK